MRKILAVFMLLSTFVSASNLDDLTPTLTLPGARGVAYTPDGQTLVVGHSDDIYIYETATGKATSRIPTDPHETLRNFSISNDGRSLVFIEGRRYQSSTDADGSHAYVYELPSGTFRFSTAANASSPYYGTAYTATFSPDSRFLVTSSWYTNGDLKTWDITTGKTTSFRYASSTVLALGFTPDGATLLTGARDHQVGWFDTRSGTALNMQYGVPNESVVALAISPDGRRVALAVGEHVVVRDVQSRRVLADLEGHTGRVNDIAWSPNGRVLASAGEDATVRIWDTDARTVLKVLNSRGPARAVAVSRDGAALAVAGDDATLVYTAPDHDAVFAPKATLFVSGLQDSMTLQVAGNSPRPVKSATSTFEVYAENQLAVTVSAPGFQPYSTTVRLAPKETRTVSVPPLQPITGGVSFTSTPNGARVSVDGRTAGVTPLTVHDLTPGHHTYTLSANGYSDATNDISVQGDQVIDAHIELREQPSLIINSNPSGATVLLGDRNAGRTPLTLRDVNSGQLRFTLRLNGYQDFEGVALVPTEGQAGVTERLTPSTPPSAVTPPAAKKAPLAVTDTSARNAVYLLDNAPALQLSALLRITDLERFGDRKTLGLVRAGQQIRLQVGPGRGDARVYSSDVLVPLATLAPLGYLARFVDGYVQITFGNDTLVIAKPQARVFSDAYLSTLQKSWTLAIRNAALVDNVLAVRAVDVPSLSLQWKLI